MPRRHVPERTCIICRSANPKREMVRIVRAPDGSVLVDTTGKQSGRGAYVCRQATCWRQVVPGRALERALKIELNVSIRERLAEFARQHVGLSVETVAASEVKDESTTL